MLGSKEESHAVLALTELAVWRENSPVGRVTIGGEQDFFMKARDDVGTWRNGPHQHWGEV